jgi:hypothetical protein
MKLSIKSMASSAVLIVLGSVSASAGPCAEHITALTKQMAASDAGMGPTGAPSKPTAGEQKGQHPGTSLTSKETAGKAISPEDVRRQSGIRTGASNALALARKLDAQGRSECMDAVKLAGELSKL